MFVPVSRCRSCGSDTLFSALTLGTTPLADGLVSSEHVDAADPTAPLALVTCADCSLVQLSGTIAPDILFPADYPYYSSVSPRLMAHFAESAQSLIQSRQLGVNSMVVEAASNDGYFLKHFQASGIPVLGIDPARGQAEQARALGIPTLASFFNASLAATLRHKDGVAADLFLANNVLAHVPDINDFVAGIAILLKEDGVAVIETPYLLDLIDNAEFDTIYHQHVFYYSVTALERLFLRHGLVINQVDPIGIHGGSIRIFVSKNDKMTDGSKAAFLAREAERRLNEPALYSGLQASAARVRHDLTSLLASLKADGARIVGYAAAAKATTMMAYCEIGRDQLDYLVDLSPAKHGKFMPGSRIGVFPTERLLEDQPDYLLILAWNFAEEIMHQQSEYRRRGGKFIIPVPELRVIN
ncbi:class I SAM-dependent methyltransferase [uncultured Maricaulis sp.]|uniref:class I SAM-dependent methyltransferase n=1 Tax=uncultured Maricaulis sp. TaxID=174710 RepID=UPI002620DDB1|nr:class I SAM-dependent methyltransferase [uncultured Maricaulis sp.]